MSDPKPVFGGKLLLGSLLMVIGILVFLIHPYADWQLVIRGTNFIVRQWISIALLGLAEVILSYQRYQYTKLQNDPIANSIAVIARQNKSRLQNVLDVQKVTKIRGILAGYLLLINFFFISIIAWVTILPMFPTH